MTLVLWGVNIDFWWPGKRKYRFSMFREQTMIFSDPGTEKIDFWCSGDRENIDVWCSGTEKLIFGGLGIENIAFWCFGEKIYCFLVPQG